MQKHDHSGQSALIRLENVTKSFDNTEVLKNITLSIFEGDLVSIIGPSGCGKSTLLRCINALEIIDGGSVRVADMVLDRRAGTDVSHKEIEKRAHRLRQSVGMVFQTFNLFPHKTIVENAMMAPMVVQGVNKEIAREIALRQLDKVGLKSLAERRPDQLSGGQIQRAAIARALAMSPNVMLYDEPTSALDPELVGEVLSVMRELNAEGMTQIIVTHEMQFAKDASDYIVFMDKGEIVEILAEEFMVEHPKDIRTQKFLKRIMSLGREDVTNG
ncbi:MAG: amino acid ABC transporter ATP-binding protein [Candidatus Kapaibacterium sp.]|jgi:polar amino acid transport system ATP-binding protein